MVVLELGGLRKHTCPCCDSKLGYTHKDIYAKEFCDSKKVYKHFYYVGSVREIDFSKEWITVYCIKCPVCGEEIELSSTPSNRTNE
jgi:hypothetical protein